jgi:HK97 family phage portal protein
VSIVIAADGGMKAWPLAGNVPVSGSVMPRSLGIDLLGLNRRASYATLYRTQPWIHTLVNKLSRGIGRMYLGSYTDEDIAKELDRDHPLPTLLRRPYPRGTCFNLKEAITGSLAVYGHAIVVKDRPGIGRAPKYLWPIPWPFVGVEAGTNQPIAAYVIQVGSVRRRILPEDVIHFMWWSADGGLGVSPLEPLRVTLQLEEASQRYSMSSFANGVRPSGALTTKAPMRRPDREALKAEIEQTHGGVDNAFRIALLTHGLEWQSMGGSAADAELINLRKINREEACAVYDIPPPAVHILDRATFSNIDEQHRMLYQDSYGPWISMEEETFAAQLIDNEPAFAGTAVHYDLDAVLRGDVEKRSQSNQRFFLSATKTPNELRRAEGDPPVPGSVNADGTLVDDHPANQVYVPWNVMPISRALDAVPEGAAGGGATPDPAKLAEFVRLAEAAGMLNGNGH